MDLTDQQWHLIQPLLHLPAHAGRGRPQIDRRFVLNGVLWKLRTASPWYHLPGDYPSWQTCYQAYRRWRSEGFMDQVYRLLCQDLRDRGGLDFLHILQEVALDLPLGCNGNLQLFPPNHKSTWQGSTHLLLLQVVLLRLKAKRRSYLAP